LLQKRIILGNGALGTLLHQMAMKHGTGPVKELFGGGRIPVRLVHIKYIRSGATLFKADIFTDHFVFFTEGNR